MATRQQTTYYYDVNLLSINSWTRLQAALHLHAAVQLSSKSSNRPHKFHHN
jgi:hypothetical protein